MKIWEPYTKFDIDVERECGVLVEQIKANGRLLGFIVEEIIPMKFSNLVKSSGVGNGATAPTSDVVDQYGNRYEVRAISLGGNHMYFYPAKAVGAGRQFDEQPYYDKLNWNRAWIMVDGRELPNLTFHYIDVETIRAYNLTDVNDKKKRQDLSMFLQLLEAHNYQDSDELGKFIRQAEGIILETNENAPYGTRINNYGAHIETLKTRKSKSDKGRHTK